MEYLKITRLNSKSSGLKVFTWIFLGLTLISLLLSALINHFLEVLLVFSPLLLLFWLFIKLLYGDKVIFTDSEIYQTNVFKKETRSIKHTEIVEIFALASCASVEEPSVSIIPFSKIMSTKESFGGTITIIISKQNRDELMKPRIFKKRLADNKNCIVLNPRKEVVDLISKILPQYIKEN